MFTRHKYRLYPNKQQISVLLQTLDLCREVYNAGLQERRDAWKKQQINISRYDQQNQLPEIKKIRPELCLIHSQVLQNTVGRLERAFKGFFRRCKSGQSPGFPRFKNKKSYNSFTYPQYGKKGFKVFENKIVLGKIGKIKTKGHRPINGKIKTLTVKLENDKWYATVCIEQDFPKLPKNHKSVGIDMGITDLATFSDGTVIENPKFYQKQQRKLRILSRSVARKKKGGSNRKKAVKRLRNLHEKIRNQREDYLHKATTKIINDYDTIAIEDIKVANLASGMLAKSFNDVSWGSFTEKLTYKAERAGRSVVKVDPRGTSQTCICGNKVPKQLKDRWHNCQDCGLSEARDLVSAKVILQRARAGLLDANVEAVSSSVV